MRCARRSCVARLRWSRSANTQHPRATSLAHTARTPPTRRGTAPTRAAPAAAGQEVATLHARLADRTAEHGGEEERLRAQVAALERTLALQRAPAGAAGSPAGAAGVLSDAVSAVAEALHPHDPAARPAAHDSILAAVMRAVAAEAQAARPGGAPSAPASPAPALTLRGAASLSPSASLDHRHAHLLARTRASLPPAHRRASASPVRASPEARETPEARWKRSDQHKDAVAV